MKLLFMAGSARKNSLNKKLCRIAAGMAEDMGADVTFIDPADYDMPLYNGDLEEEHGLPEKALDLKLTFEQHDGFFICAPEYNSSLTPLLKNTLDWISRPHRDGESSLTAFKGKVAGLSSCSPGSLGGMRGLVPLRMMLGNIGVNVTPTQACIGSAMKAFDESGNLTDAKHIKTLKNAIKEFVTTTKRQTSTG